MGTHMHTHTEEPISPTLSFPPQPASYSVSFPHISLPTNREGKNLPWPKGSEGETRAEARSPRERPTSLQSKGQGWMDSQAGTW